MAKQNEHGAHDQVRAKRSPTDERVRAALECIPPSIERGPWVKVGMSLHAFYGASDAGFHLFDAWSAASDKYKKAETAKLWKSWKPGGPVQVGTLLAMAQEYGFDLAAQYRNEEAAEKLAGGAKAPSTMTEADRQRVEREHAEAAERFRVQLEREHAEAAEVARQRWDRASSEGRSAYLERKGIQSYVCRFEANGAVLVPMRDVDGVLWAVQSIEPGGRKLFQKNARTSGLMCWLGEPVGAPTLLMAEGFATAATLHAATGLPVVVAFSAGNLLRVAEAVRGRFEGARWIVAGDDDRDTFERTGTNPGRVEAAKAAEILSASLAFPEGLPDRGTDFNDLAAARGLEAVAVLIRAAAEPHDQASARSLEGSNGSDKASTPARPKSKPSGRKRGSPRGGRGGADSGDESERTDPFLLTEEGVFYVSRDPAGSLVPRKVCAPVEVIAETRNPDGSGWGKLLRFVDRDGERRDSLVPAELFAGDGVELRKTLAGLGLWITPITGLRARLVEYFETREVRTRARTVGATGWFDGNFVTPGETIGESSERIIYHAQGDPGLRLEQKGTLEGWRREVAKLAERNTRLMFGIAASFAGPLLALSGERNGGFHLRGTSQDGKTTVMTAAASVYSAPSYVRKWRTTDNGVEGVAVLHSDLPLLLDELHMCPPRMLGEIAYMLAEGSGKARGGRDGGLRSVPRWRTLILSTGETGFAERMAEADVRATARQEMRFAEIPASPEGGFGVFEHLHGELSGEAFAVRLRKAVESEHGTAGRAWLTWLVKHHAEAQVEVPHSILELARRWTPEGAAGQVASVARRFALVAVAGEMATRAGITGWAKGAATAAVRACFEAWIDVRGGTGRAEERELLRRLQNFLQVNEHRFELWERAHDSRAPKTIDRAGFKKRFFNGSPFNSMSDAAAHLGTEEPTTAMQEGLTMSFYLFPDVFLREVVGEADKSFAHRVLVERGILRTEKNGATTRPYRRERIPGGTLTKMYVIEHKGRAALDDALYALGG